MSDQTKLFLQFINPIRSTDFPHIKDNELFWILNIDYFYIGRILNDPNRPKYFSLRIIQQKSHSNTLISIKRQRTPYGVNCFTFDELEATMFALASGLTLKIPDPIKSQVTGKSLYWE